MGVCKCNLISKVLVRTAYAGLSTDKAWNAHLLKTPGGSEYFRVFFDETKPELFYNVTVDQAQIVKYIEEASPEG